MPEIGRQHRQAGVDVLSGPIPAEQRPNCECVAQIVNPRRRGRFSSDSCAVAEVSEHRVDRLINHPVAPSRDEEAHGRRFAVNFVAQAGIALQRGQHRRLQRHHARLAELRLADRQRRVGFGDVAAVESDGFTDPHTGGRQQPNHGFMCCRSEPSPQALRTGHQRVDVVGAEDERLVTVSARTDQPERRDLGARVESGHVPGESACDGHPVRAHRARRIDVGRVDPRQRGSDGHRLQAGIIEEGDETRQQPMVFGQLVAQAIAQPQVIRRGVGQRAHRSSPGQGRAIDRSVATSTFA